MQTNKLIGAENRKEDSLDENSLFSAYNHAVLELILADIYRLWEIRHWIPNPGKLISDYSKRDN